jgi:hypothetical protein
MSICVLHVGIHVYSLRLTAIMGLNKLITPTFLRWMSQVNITCIRTIFILIFVVKYDKKDQQGKAAFNERNPHTTQQQEPVASSPGGQPSKCCV